MIARVTIPIPFSILIAADETLPIFSVERMGYKISHFPPLRDTNLVSQVEPSILKLNEKDAILCNLIVIDFQKEEFDRTISSDPSKMFQFEPPLEFINQVLNDFLIRLRHLTNAPQIHYINLHYTQWQIKYLKNDGSEFQEESGKLRGRGTKTFEIKHVPLPSDIWSDIFELPQDFFSQYWIDLLLDGLDELPEIGPSIVLTHTALEVFIAKILNQLATAEKISPEFWEWINNRRYPDQLPTIEEKYDTLLQNLTGHTLKEDTKLWSVFQNLRTARNTFVHEGIAKISLKSQAPPLTRDEARNLVILSNMIPYKIREWLPKSVQWELNKNYNTKSFSTWPMDFQRPGKVVNSAGFPIPPGSVLH